MLRAPGHLTERLRRTPLLGEVTGARARGMDVLRLAAATLVIVAHSYNLTLHEEPFRRFGGPELGDIAVAVFFAISGFLVTASWLSDPRVRSFVLRRALRILPGLWVVLLVTVLAGLVLTARPLATYLSSLDTWRYPLERAVVYSTRPSLPGVFTTNPYGSAVNGSLWTLPVEATAYVATLVFGVTGLLARRRELVVAAILLLFVIQETVLPSASGLVATDSPGAVLHWLVHFGLFYAMGALLFLYREHVRLSFAAAAAAIVVWGLSFDTGAVTIVGQLALPYVVLVLGYRAPAAVDVFFRRVGDISYGTYIYAFPVQQTLIHYDTGISPPRLILLSIPITYACAYASWHLVERPALRLRRRMTGEPDHAARAAVVPATGT